MKKEKNKKHHHRIVPVALIALGIPVALVTIFLISANLLFHDEQPPNDSSLLLPNVTVADEDNAYTDIQKLDTDEQAVDLNNDQPSNDKSIDTMLNGGTWDDAHVTTLLTKYATVISDFHAAAKKLQYQDPYAAHPSTLTMYSPLPDVGTPRSVGRLVALESIRKAKNGDIAGGLSEATEVVKLGDMIESGQGTLIQWLVGSATKLIGLTALRQIGLQTTLTADQAKTTNQAIETYRDSQVGLVKAMKSEYAYSILFYQQQRDFGQAYDSYFLSTDSNGQQLYRSTTGKILSALDAMGLFRFYYWPNQNLRFMVEAREQLVDVAKTNCATGNLGEIYPPQRSQRSGFGRLLEPNAIGKLLADIGRISYGGIVPKRCNESLAVSATQATFAISAYQHDNGKPPVMLNELVPKYLANVPLDPYSGKVLNYDAAKKIVYSVGQDRKDEHGNTKKMTDYTTLGGDWQNMLDPTFVVGK